MKVLQTHVESLYGKFVDLVANGRGLTPQVVHKHAEGRVWMGEDAHEIGLVQELGGLYDAIDRAAELAELGDGFEVIEIPEVSNPMDEFTEMLDAEAKVHTSSQMTTLQALASASGLERCRVCYPCTGQSPTDLFLVILVSWVLWFSPLIIICTKPYPSNFNL